jgi:hypothetical protein
MIDLNKLIEYIVELYYKFINNKKVIFEKFGIFKSFKKLGNSIKKGVTTAVNTVKDVAKKYVPIPKASYIPVTYPKHSYDRGAGVMPFTIEMRPYKPGKGASKY